MREVERTAAKLDLILEKLEKLEADIAKLKK